MCTLRLIRDEFLDSSIYFIYLLFLEGGKLTQDTHPKMHMHIHLVVPLMKEECQTQLSSLALVSLWPRKV